MSLQTNCAQIRTEGNLPISGFVSEDRLGLEASCHVAFEIVKEEKPHTIGEWLTEPYPMDIIENKTKEES